MAEIQKVDGLEAGRPETGPMQFGDDWPGVFIRGDNAMFYAMNLRQVLGSLPDCTQKSSLAGLAKILSSSRV